MQYGQEGYAFHEILLLKAFQNMIKGYWLYYTAIQKESYIIMVIECLQFEGTYALEAALPAVGGAEGTAEVAEVGSEVVGFSKGDQVVLRVELGLGRCTCYSILASLSKGHFLSHGWKPEENISHASTVISPRFSN